MTEMIVSQEQYNRGYKEKIGATMETRQYRLIRKLHDGDILVEEPKLSDIYKTFYFTFGSGQPHENRFVKIRATSWELARKQMIERFGSVWAFQYSGKEWYNKNGVSQEKEYNLKELS